VSRESVQASEGTILVVSNRPLIPVNKRFGRLDL
jgi:hypothetical protein